MQLARNAISSVTFTHIIILALAIRLLLIVYAEFHDARSVMKYTDVDYRVFSDAARFIRHPTDDNKARGVLGSIMPLGEYVICPPSSSGTDYM